MTVDRFGLHHRSTDAGALASFETAVHAVAAHRPSAAEGLQDALAADPDLVAAHALKGLAAVVLAKEELGPAAARAHADAVAARERAGGSTAGEDALVDALELAAQGKLRSGAARLEAHLDRHPRAFLPLKIAHALRFMAGDARGMLVTTARVLDAWSPAMAGYGFVLGCHAFGLEELGELSAAERVGREAVAHEPADSWGLHAVSHVHEMQGRTGEGIAWLEGARPVWTACNNFSFHMAWHLALFHLERGEHERVLDLYDAEVRPKPTDDFRDMANAVSLLWRLEQDGVAVGERWDELRRVALGRRLDTTLTFATLHSLMALVATGEIEAAGELVAAVEAKTAVGGEQAAVMGSVGLELARTILALATDRTSRAGLDVLASRLPSIGGSHAQRDVFLRTLAGLAAERGDRGALDGVLSARRRLKRDDAFAGRMMARCAARPSKPVPRTRKMS
jgi:hypothetical protein